MKYYYYSERHGYRVERAVDKANRVHFRTIGADGKPFRITREQATGRALIGEGDDIPNVSLGAEIGRLLGLRWR